MINSEKTSTAIEPIFLGLDDAARLIALTPRALQRMQKNGGASAPPTVRVGARVLYPLTGLRAWGAAQVEASR